MSETPARSLYVHVPFCAHRCGYCDFVTTSAQPELHERYVAGLAREHAARGLSGTYDTVFVGGGTPTLLQPAAMDMLLGWIGEVAAPGAEVTMECNPETVTPKLAQQLVSGGVSRVSLGAQSFDVAVLEVLERRATPDVVRDAVGGLRDAGLERLSLDLIWGVPGQTAAGVARDVAEVLALGVDHASAYELEFKPGTRLTHRYRSREKSVGDAADDLYDLVVDAFEAAGWWWYETANFARTPDERCRHNLAYWTAAPHDGVGVGAYGTDGAGLRRHNLPNVPRWLAAVEEGREPPARNEQLSRYDRRVERVMLGLRLDEPLAVSVADLDDGIVDQAGVERVVQLGLATAAPREDGGFDLRLVRRGRMLLGEVLAQVIGDGLPTAKGPRQV